MSWLLHFINPNVPPKCRWVQSPNTGKWRFTCDSDWKVAQDHYREFWAIHDKKLAENAAAKLAKFAEDAAREAAIRAKYPEYFPYDWQEWPVPNKADVELGIAVENWVTQMPKYNLWDAWRLYREVLKKIEAGEWPAEDLKDLERLRNLKVEQGNTKINHFHHWTPSKEQHQALVDELFRMHKQFWNLYLDADKSPEHLKVFINYMVKYISLQHDVVNSARARRGSWEWRPWFSNGNEETLILDYFYTTANYFIKLSKETTISRAWNADEIAILLELDGVSNLRYGLLFILALSSLSVYSIVLAGWASNSKYAFLGALRSAAQMISYEVAISLTLLPVVLLAGSLNLTEIVFTQHLTASYFIPLLPAALVFLVTMLAETNRTPFDLPEAEAELVAGYNVDYSSLPFAMFFLGEYANMIQIATLFCILFWAGWYMPLEFWVVEGALLQPPTLALKGAVLWIYFIIVRAVLPRYRYDQLMDACWKAFLLFAGAFFFVVVGSLYSADLTTVVEEIYLYSSSVVAGIALDSRTKKEYKPARSTWIAWDN